MIVQSWEKKKIKAKSILGVYVFEKKESSIRAKDIKIKNKFNEEEFDPGSG